MWRSLMLTRIVRPSPALETLLDSLDLNLSRPQRDHLLHLVDSLLVCEQRKTLAALQRQFLDATDPSELGRFPPHQSLVRRGRPRCPPTPPSRLAAGAGSSAEPAQSPVRQPR